MENMDDPIYDVNVYRLPVKEILRNRREFFGLWRRSDDKTVNWLERVQSCIHRCKFPTNIFEFLLFDRFVCGLNANELESIQNVNNSWTFKQLLEHVSSGDIDTGHTKSDVSNLNQSESTSLDLVKSEPVGVKYIHL